LAEAVKSHPPSTTRVAPLKYPPAGEASMRQVPPISDQRPGRLSSANYNQETYPLGILLVASSIGGQRFPLSSVVKFEWNRPVISDFSREKEGMIPGQMELTRILKGINPADIILVICSSTISPIFEREHTSSLGLSVREFTT
jgi:hypothetical protein